MNKFLKESLSYLIIIIVVVLFRTFIMTPAVVDGDSMNDTLKDHDLVIVNKIGLSLNEIERFDVVVIKTNGEKIIKRVIGLPNETIEYKDNTLYINENEIDTSKYNFKVTDDFKGKTDSNEYYVLGDNRSNSKDSRLLDAFSKEDIIGLVNFRFYPFDKIGKFE